MCSVAILLYKQTFYYMQRNGEEYGNEKYRGRKNGGKVI